MHGKKVIHPRYFELLSKDDQQKYLELRKMLSSNICKNNRNKRVETFSDTIQAIKGFCMKQDDSVNNWVRSLVTGILWLPDGGLAVNIRQLRILIDKCKSTINGSFLRLGYYTAPSNGNITKIIETMIPLLAGKYEQLREWTIRVKIGQTYQINVIPVGATNQVTMIPVTHYVISPLMANSSSTTTIKKSEPLST